MGSLELSCVFCQLFHALPRVGGKYIFYPHPKSEERAWGTCHILLFSFLVPMTIFSFPESFLPTPWQRTKREWKSTKGQNLGSLLEKGGLWIGLLLGRSLLGCGLELSKPMGEAEEKGGRQAKEEGKPHPLNPLCFPLLPEERISESGTISAELVCPPNYIYRRQHWPVRVERTVTVERQRVPKATGGRGGPRRKNTELRRKFSQTHLSTWGKKFRAESEQELPKGKHDVPQRAGFLRFVICLLPANPHMHRPYLEF